MKQFKNFNEFKITKMMNKENIKQISKDIEIGNHSYYHSSMLEETDNFFLKDLVKSQNYFYNNFNFYPDIYAFPNGSYNYNKILIAKKNGIKKILLVGTKLSKFNENIFFRINFHSSSNNENIYKVMRNYNRI